MAKFGLGRSGRGTTSSPPVKPSPQVKRSPVMVVAGIVLVIAGALVSVGIYSHLSQTQEVIVVVHDVARGQRIQRTDLTTAQVGFDALLKPLPASELNQVVGEYAASDLVPGTFLVAGSVGSRLSPGTGQSEIGIALMAGDYPDDGLLPGDEVQLIAVPDKTEPGAVPVSYNGTLATITTPADNTMITVSVLVNSEDAPQLAMLAASDRIALVLTAREH